MTGSALPPAVRAALEEPTAGERLRTVGAGITFSSLAWGDPLARPLLLLHGVTSSAATWWRLGPALAASDRRVVAVDLPGHGLTGQWTGHHRFRDNASDVAAFAAAAGLARAGLQVIGHSWGAMTAAALPAAGLRPETIVLLDPPAVPLDAFEAMAADPDSRTFDTIDEAIVAVRAHNPEWQDGDVRAKAEALTQLDPDAALAVLLRNGDWDGGLADLAHPAASGIPLWVVRGDPAAGGLLPDAALPAFLVRAGPDHVLTIPGAAHSPQRIHPVETTAALLRALEG